MPHPIDLATWNRREHFEFFSRFDEPFHGVAASVACTGARAEARRLGVSFFLYYLYHTVQAVNAVENLRYRIDGDGRPVCYDRVHASATIGRADHTFGFSFIEQHEALADFVRGAEAEMAAVRAGSGLGLGPRTARPDVIHFSALPWVRFTGLTHARAFGGPDSAPKVSVGQLYEEGGAARLPVAVHVHHGLADGYHVGLLLAELERRLA